MTLRTFVFRVKKSKRGTVVSFMRRGALPLVRRVPGCRAAYFTRSSERKGEYMWVTVWSSPAAVRAAERRKDWKRIVKEEEGRFFAGKPRAEHYKVLLKK